MWIAKDLDSSVWLYECKPVKNEIDFKFYPTDDSDTVIELSCTDKELKNILGILNLTFENSPIEIEIKVKQ